MTINQLVKSIKELAEGHRQIETVHYGSLLEIFGKADIMYPVFAMDLIGTQISRNQMSVSMNFFFLDRILPERTNELEVFSDQLQIAGDIIAQLRSQSFDFSIQDNIRANFVTDTTPDMLAGVSITISIDIDYLASRCDVPSTYEV